jgi:hypothetical protein
MADVYADLAFLKSILSFTRDPSISMEDKYYDIILVIYNQLDKKIYHNPRAKAIGERINPNLVYSIASSFKDCVDKYGRDEAVNILDKRVTKAVKAVTKQTDEELDKELRNAKIISDLLVNGIHIEE